MINSPSIMETCPNMATILPGYPRLNPGHDLEEDHALNLCVRKGPLSPHCPQDCDSAYTPNFGRSEDSSSDCPSTPKAKISRPFKVYPMHPLVGFPMITCPDILDDSTKAYADFREKMLAQIQDTHNRTNKNMRRSQNIHNPRNADPGYLEKRRKNNEAAKRSRDARRAKEDELTITCHYLKWENLQLRAKLTALMQRENEKFRANEHHPSI